MLKNYLTLLKKLSKKFVKTYGVFDIILYGSVAKGKENPRDIDILIIFVDKSLRERLNAVSEFKELTKKEIKNIDVKTINLTELFDKSFLARQGILLEGISLINGEKLSKKLGFTSCVLFNYDLKKLNHNDKTKFTYALIGRKNIGMIKKLDATHLGKGVVSVPMQNSQIFEDFLKKWQINYKLQKILISLI